MFKSNPYPKDTFTEGYRSLNGGLLIFGLSLVTFAVLIFLFPALIGFLFAAFILMAGAAVLIAAWKMYRFKERLKTFEKEPRPFHGTLRTEGPRYTQRRFTWIIR